MKNYKGPSNPLTLVAAGALTGGQGLLVGTALFGVVGNAAATGESYALWVEGQFELPKLSTDVCAVGDRLYWDDTNKRLTKTTTNNLNVGTCTVAAGNGATVVVVTLEPQP